ncbi:MAG: hypothetical protein A4E32_01214 [Methanomassiliicoccales archaeon PtaU1.Bin124]|nr:MAG: hypothetical protein A4E32_01214 [Methanomassiliicoccales archaeon PtaU1.Bin124]
MIRSDAEKCPFCCAELEFHDIDDLEKVANGHSIEEKTCEPVKEVPKPRPQPETKVEMKHEEPERQGRFGKLFGRGKK